MWSWLDVFIVASSLWEVVVDIVALVLEGQGRELRAADVSVSIKHDISLWKFWDFPRSTAEGGGSFTYVWWKMENGQMNKGKCLGNYSHPSRRIWKIFVSKLIFSHKRLGQILLWEVSSWVILWVSNFVDFIAGWWWLRDSLRKHNSASNLTRSQHFLSELISWWCYTLPLKSGAKRLFFWWKKKRQPTRRCWKQINRFFFLLWPPRGFPEATSKALQANGMGGRRKWMLL